MNLNIIQIQITSLTKKNTIMMSYFKGFQRLNLTSIRSNQSRIFRGLEEFFENGTALPKDKITTGRSWRPDELRLKSFEDLHKLWFVNLKEKNLLATQKAEAKKYQISEEFFSNKHRYVKVRKNMARILTILNERRIQWELAQKESKYENKLEEKKVENN